MKKLLGVFRGLLFVVGLLWKLFRHHRYYVHFFRKAPGVFQLRTGRFYGRGEVLYEGGLDYAFLSDKERLTKLLANRSCCLLWDLDAPSEDGEALPVFMDRNAWSLGRAWMKKGDSYAWWEEPVLVKKRKGKRKGRRALQKAKLYPSLAFYDAVTDRCILEFVDPSNGRSCGESTVMAVYTPSSVKRDLRICLFMVTWWIRGDAADRPDLKP